MIRIKIYFGSYLQLAFLILCEDFLNVAPEGQLTDEYLFF